MTPDKTVVHTDKAPKAIGPYSQAIVQEGWIYTAGQIALDPATMELSGKTAAEQAERVLKNLTAVLDAAGARLDDVVKTTIFLASMGDFQAVNEVYARHFKAPFPARSTVAAAALPKGALVEIDCVARKPEIARR